MLARATSVILLTNPDHNTALNRRKDLIRRGALCSREELDLCTAMLSEARNSKASLLWHHRRWLLQTLYPPSHPDSILRGEGLDYLPIPVEVLALEFDIVEKAAEAYPRNYHAWAHRFACLRCLVVTAKQENAQNVFDAVAGECERVERWVERHVGDHTAMHYLCRVIEAAWELGITEDLGANGEPRVLSHAMGMVRSYSAHESVWIYLREVCLLLRRRDAFETFDWDGGRAFARGFFLEQHDSRSKERIEKIVEGERTLTADDLTREQQKKTAALARRFCTWCDIMVRRISFHDLFDH